MFGNVRVISEFYFLRVHNKMRYIRYSLRILHNEWKSDLLLKVVAILVFHIAPMNPLSLIKLHLEPCMKGMESLSKITDTLFSDTNFNVCYSL